MAQPDNPKLYNALGLQAQAKYPAQRSAGLSPAAGKWRQNEYLKQGGSFVENINQVDPKKRDYKQEALDSQKRKKKALKKKIQNSGFVA